MRRGRAWQFLTLALAIAWAAGLRAAIVWRHRSLHDPSHATTDTDPARTRETVALVRRLPGIHAPGRPVRAPDAATLDAKSVIALLRAKRTDELGEVLEAAQDEFEREPGKERLVEGLLGGFSFAGPPDLPILDDWLERTPRSFAPYAARGAARLAMLAQADPLTECASGGRKDASAETRAAAVRARDDLDSALALRPRFAVGITLLMKTFLAECSSPPRALLERALQACPACGGARLEYLLGLRPAYGGTESAMRAFAEEGLAAAPENPRLRALPGYVDWDEASRLLRDGKWRGALDACDRALAVYPDPEFFRLKAAVLYRMERHQESVDASTRVLEANSFDVEARVERARANTRLKKWRDVSHDLRLALQLAPEHEGAIDLYGWLVEHFEALARRSLNLGELNEAFETYEVAASIVPERIEFRQARDAIALRTGLRAPEHAEP